jgi:hypothetical protein
MPFAALVSVIIYFMISRINYKTADMAICGLVSGLAYIMRYNAISVFFAVCLIVIIINVKKVRLSLRLKDLLVYIIFSALIIIPWFFYSGAVTGDYFYQKNHLNAAYEIYGKGLMGWDQWWVREAPGFRSIADVLFRDPIVLLQRLLINLAEHFTVDMFWFISIWWGILAVGGLYTIVRERLNLQQWAIFIFCAIYFLSLVPFFYSDRFSLPLLPFYLLLAVLFLSWITRRVGNHRRVLIGFFIFLGIIGISFYRTVRYNYQHISSEPHEVLEIAEKYASFNQDSNTEGKVIIARKPHAPYYLGMAFHPLPLVNSVGELLEYCHAHHVDYVFASKVEVVLRPELSTLLDVTHPPDGFSPIVRTDAFNAVLYKVEPKGTK